jgi:predicted pyridoxine 5'-phosphate oxidase superfamily flavin-nucleotide-binding protein
METSRASPWHAGELAWQKRLGVAERMAEIGPRVIGDAMPEQHRVFFNQLPFILAGYEDDFGQVWASMLGGPPGFVSSPDPRRLLIAANRAAGDPIALALHPGAALGVLGIELPTRRRNRANGRVERVDAAGILLAVEQSFGNCPKYIERRDYAGASAARRVTAVPVAATDAAVRRLVGDAGTFFVASIAGPGGLPDVSHRGGRPGFVAVREDGTLIVPDYSGNFFFNTLGNFLLDPRAGLLFPDFARGDLLQMSGQVSILPEPPGGVTMPGAERYWQFKPEQAQWLQGGLPIGFSDGEISSFSP